MTAVRHSHKQVQKQIYNQWLQIRYFRTQQLSVTLNSMKNKLCHHLVNFICLLSLGARMGAVLVGSPLCLQKSVTVDINA